MLYQLIADELETFREHARATDGPGLPTFLLEELESFLECGIVGLGFARVRCHECHEEILVGFSCGSRGLVPLLAGANLPK